MRNRKNSKIRNTKKVKGTNTLLNYLQNPLKIEDLHQKTTGTDPLVFNLTMKVFNNLHNIQFEHQFEEKSVTMTHDTLFGFIYSIVHQILDGMDITNDTNEIENLISFNLSNFFLFFSPENVTEEEETWVECQLQHRNKKLEIVNVPLQYRKNYLINLKRMMNDYPESNILGQIGYRDFFYI